jgi:hypothetical protein
MLSCNSCLTINYFPPRSLYATGFVLLIAALLSRGTTITLCTSGVTDNVTLKPLNYLRRTRPHRTRGPLCAIYNR